jgi:hypothetical protein
MAVTDEMCIAKIYAGRTGSKPKWKLLVLIDGAAASRCSAADDDFCVVAEICVVPQLIEFDATRIQHRIA